MKSETGSSGTSLKPRCFVTGATGHLGSFLVRHLVEEGHEVAILMRDTSNPWRLAGVLDKVHSIEGELSDGSGWRQQLITFSPQIVFHLAWEGILSDARNSAAQVTRNVIHTLSLLEIIRDAGAKIFVGCGSQAEYGACDARISESQPAAPQNPYGVAKYALSLLVHSFCKSTGIRGVWLRIFSVYGPMDDERHMLPSVILKLLHAEPVALTAGAQVWDYLYIDDAVRAIYAAALAHEASGVFNVASGKGTPLRRIVESVRDLIHPALPLAFGEIPYAAGQVMHLEGDIRRLNAATAWLPEVELAEGLARTVAWYRDERSKTFALSHGTHGASSPKELGDGK